MRKILLLSALMLCCNTVGMSAYAASIDYDIQNLQAQIDELKERLEEKDSKYSDVEVSLKPTLKIKSKDGKYELRTSGRIHVDYGVFNDDKVDHPDAANLRRARLSLKGKVDRDWRYALEVDFSNEDVSLQAAKITYIGLDIGDITLGNHKPFFSLEETNSSNNVTFIERAAPVLAFANSYELGLSFINFNKSGSLGLGIWNDDAGSAGSDDEGWKIAGRATYAPISEKYKTVHLGLSSIYQAPGGGSNSTRFRTKAENKITTERAVDTGKGKISDVDNILKTSFEVAGMLGSLSAQAEYIFTNVTRDAFTDADFNGWYFQTSLFLTGESRNYRQKSGKFGSIKVIDTFDIKKGGTGAWEIATRYSSIDLTDGDITGGEMGSWTVGVNWYMNNNSRLMFNYISVDTDENAKNPDDDPGIFLMRAQVNF